MMLILLVDYTDAIAYCRQLRFLRTFVSSFDVLKHDVSQNFVDSIENGFLTQHVTERAALLHGAVLDLVITSEPDMIDDVSVLGRFGTSDHNILQWEIQLCSVYSVLNRNCLNYADADFPAIRRALRATNWQTVLQGDDNQQWQSFHQVLNSLESTCLLRNETPYEGKPHGCLTRPSSW